MRVKLVLWLSFALPVWSCAVTAYESDQYTNRLVPVTDAVTVMDRFVNEHLEQIVSTWQGPRDDSRLALMVYDHFGSWYWVDKMERWSMNSPQLVRYPQHKYHSIYRGMPLWVTRVGFLFGVGTVNKLNGVRVGSDKFGHFFSQGLKYYRREERGWSLPRIIESGVFAERWIFGQWTTGVYSNADLVANYEGFLFYRSLSQDNVINGKDAIIGWEGDRPFMQRQFTWRDHVTDYWDEALNPSFLSGALQQYMVSAIEELCDEFWQEPGEFIPHEDAELWQRYSQIGLKDARYNRFDRICTNPVAAE